MSVHRCARKRVCVRTCVCLCECACMRVCVRAFLNILVAVTLVQNYRELPVQLFVVL